MHYRGWREGAAGAASARGCGLAACPTDQSRMLRPVTTNHDPPRSRVALLLRHGLMPLLLGLLFTVIYLLSGALEPTHFNAHVYLADAMLHGRLTVDAAPGHMELVTRDGHQYLSYGIGPALLMLPFSLIWGLSLHQGLFSAAFGGAAVALWWLTLGRLKIEGATRSWLTAAFGLGSLFWFYAGQSGSTWWMLHVTTVCCLLLAIHETLGQQRGWLIGLAVGMAILTRTTVLFSLPFFVGMLWLLPRHGPDGRLRAVAACLLSLGALMSLNLWYNWVCFGHPLVSGYALQISGEPAAHHGPFSLVYIAQNPQGYFLKWPVALNAFPWFDPTRDGFSILISLPTLLLALRADYRDRLTQLALLACLSVMAIYLCYYWSGFAQFGRRYSVDFLPFAMLLIAAGARRSPRYWLPALTLAGVVVQVWGITWWHYKGW